MFNWEKKGKIFDPTGRFEWMQHYAQVPTVLELEDRLRIYFTCRPKPDANDQFVSYTSFVDVKKEDPSKILYIHDNPVIDLGKPGTFDEFGIHPTSILKWDNKILLYYTGWTRGYSVPYETWIGLAISYDNGITFTKASQGPIIGKSQYNPYLANGAFVYRKDHKWYMFYAGARKWIQTKNKLEPIYHLKLATSKDGIQWECKSKEIIKAKFEFECISRPTIWESNGRFHMWFAYRSGIDNFREEASMAYSIGYASSKDFITWERKDEISGLKKGKRGWDSDMMSYPYVHQYYDNLYIFYNGNSFGKEGFGYALLNLNQK